MVSFIELLGRLVASALDPIVGASTPAALLALAGLAGALGIVAVVAASALRSQVVRAASLGVRARRMRGLEPADKGELLKQSDPDAAGRARPRAPGRTLQTA